MNQRSQVLASLADSQPDLVVIGGGLTGAAIALEAANGGLSVLLVDKDDFAGGSSSRTSKLAGAANYPRSGDFNFSLEKFTRAFKSSHESSGQLFQRAPHMVKDFTFVMPIAPGQFLPSLKVQLGLALYDLSSKQIGKGKAHKRLNRKETLRVSQTLAPHMVTGSLCFHDLFTDDSRLVLELIKAAAAKGAATINYIEAREFTNDNGRISTITLRDRIDGKEYIVRPKTVVSACGVWTDVLTETIGIANAASPGENIEQENAEQENAIAMVDPPLKFLRSTHIILPPSAFDTASALLLQSEADSERYVFVVPWQRALLVGTTSAPHEGSLESPVPTAAEIDYLLHTINRYIRPDRKVTGSDIACAWACLSIQPVEKDGEPSVFRASNAVVTAYGTNLSNFPKVASEAVRLINYQLSQINQNFVASTSKSENVMLGGFIDKNDYLATTAEISSRARKLNIEPASLDHLTSNYGKDALLVLELIEAKPSLNERICPDFPPLMAEVVHCIENEMAISLEDILCRRIRLGFLHREQCLDAAPRVAKMMQEICEWDSLRFKAELSALARNLASQLAPVS